MRVEIKTAISDIPLPTSIAHPKAEWRTTLENLKSFLSIRWAAGDLNIETLPFYVDDTDMGNFQILPVAVQTWSNVYCREFFRDLVRFICSCSLGYYIALVPEDGELLGYDVEFFYTRVERDCIYCVPGKSNCIEVFGLDTDLDKKNISP